MIDEKDFAKADDALRNAKTIAVVGLDDRTERPAHGIAEYLHKQGYRIIPVPTEGHWVEEVFAEKAYPRVQDIPGQVDLVDVFVRGEDTDPVIDDAIAAKAGGVWLQIGITNDAGLERAKAAGLAVSQDRCAKVEHRRMTAAAR